MQVTFFVKTQTDERIDRMYIVGSCKEMGYVEENALPMTRTEEGWKVSLSLENSNVRYSYILKKGNDTVSEDWMCRKIDLPHTLKVSRIAVMDIFENVHYMCDVLRTKLFTNIICKHTVSESIEVKHKPTIVFTVRMSNLLSEHDLYLCSDMQSQNWDPTKAIKMYSPSTPNFWCSVDSTLLTNKTIEYKYIFRNKDPKVSDSVVWEADPNRTFKLPSGKFDIIVVNDGIQRFKDLPNIKASGLAIPVFSIRTKNSFGCGEFSDLKILAKWARKVGMKMIQTLPVNDTTSSKTWKDSYPYSAISSFALHPMYISLNEVGVIPDPIQYEKWKEEMESLSSIDYDKVMRSKFFFLRKMFDRDWESTVVTHSYKIFFESNSYWLKPYAAFCYFRDINNTCEVSQWGAASKYSDELVEKVTEPSFKDYKKVALYFFIQYHLDKQLRSAVEFCHTIGVGLKGDIPIGMHVNSVDVWQFPKLFDLNGSAGAPPDDFARIGQNWGFPTYNWDEMKKDDYNWWRSRFTNMAKYFDAYRIDHILGFFRIYRIPRNSVWGLTGQFVPVLAMTADEIKSFGIEFDEDKMCEPDFSDDVLREIFGDEDLIVKEKYLRIVNGKRCFNPEVDTQKKIVSFVPYSSDAEKKIRDGLLELSCQVLFVRDYKDSSKFHPRIAIGDSAVFKTYSKEVQDKLYSLYNYFYYERNDSFWADSAKEKLPTLIRSTDMMSCGEDLGMLPVCVSDVMRELGILSLEIERMRKGQYNDCTTSEQFFSRIPYESVCTTSTHDMNPMRAWWEEIHNNPSENTQHYFNSRLNFGGNVPYVCEPYIAEKIISNHLASASMWVILPIQDWLAIDGDKRREIPQEERINDPSNPDNYWNYRMHIGIEDLMSSVSLSEKILYLNRLYKRSF